MQIAIVEDDIHYQRELQGYLLDYEKEYSQDFKIHVFSDGDEITQDYRCKRYMEYPMMRILQMRFIIDGCRIMAASAVIL